MLMIKSIYCDRNNNNNGGDDDDDDDDDGDDDDYDGREDTSGPRKISRSEY